MSVVVAISFGLGMAYLAYRKQSNQLKNQNLDDIKIDIGIISLNPPSGSTIRVGEKITVTMRYQCEAPYEQEFSAWAMIDEDMASTYEASVDVLTVGSGKFKRWVSLSSEGEITSLRVAVQTYNHQHVYEKCFPVSYKVVENENLKYLKNDGIDSRVLGISFKPSDSRQLKVGTDIVATLEYDIKSIKGLNVYIIPEEMEGGTYQSSEKLLNGRGQVKRYFNMGNARHLEAVFVTMYNEAQELVLEERHIVNYEFVD